MWERSEKNHIEIFCAHLLAWTACIVKSNVEIGWSHIDIGLLVNSFDHQQSQIFFSKNLTRFSLWNVIKMHWIYEKI